MYSVISCFSNVKTGPKVFILPVNFTGKVAAVQKITARGTKKNTAIRGNVNNSFPYQYENNPMVLFPLN